MLIRPAIGDTDPIRYRRPTPDGQFSGNILDEAMRPTDARSIKHLGCRSGPGPHAVSHLSPLGRWLVDIQNGIAHAHFFLGRYDEAASWAATALQDNPDFQAGVRISAASNAIAGRPEQAHQAVVPRER